MKQEPKDPKATDRKRSEGVISKAHQYARICKGDIAVFIRNGEGKCKVYQSGKIEQWKTFLQHIRSEASWIIDIEPGDLDENGRKKNKRKFHKKRLPTSHQDTNQDVSSPPKLPSIESDSEEWLLLERNNNYRHQKKTKKTFLELQDMPETISVNWDSGLGGNIEDMEHFPILPSVDFH